MWEKGYLIGVGFVLLAALVLITHVTGQPQIETNEASIETQNFIDAVVEEIENIHCNITDEEILAQGLTMEKVQQAREFCKLSTDEKKSLFKNELTQVQENAKDSQITGFSNSYSCNYGGTRNTGIPTYGDLGLNNWNCVWHDPNPVCRVQGGVACLWGCTNADPSLGWHTKRFSSTSALENEIFPRGYHRVNDYAGGSYRRWLSYGYSYQVHYASNGYWHSEGPEPSAEFSWYAFLNGWYFPEARDWHQAC